MDDVTGDAIITVALVLSLATAASRIAHWQPADPLCLTAQQTQRAVAVMLEMTSSFQVCRAAALSAPLAALVQSEDSFTQWNASC